MPPKTGFVNRYKVPIDLTLEDIFTPQAKIAKTEQKSQVKNTRRNTGTVAKKSQVQAKKVEKDDVFLMDLHRDTLREIFTYLDVVSLVAVGKTNKLSREILNDLLLWKALYERYFENGWFFHIFYATEISNLIRHPGNAYQSIVFCTNGKRISSWNT